MAAASSSSSFSSESREVRQIQPLNIDFAKKEEEANSGIFTNKKIHQYAIEALKKIAELNAQIVSEIREYNLGNTGYRDSIFKKIKSILKGITHEPNFPKVFAKNQIQSLEGFFSQIRSECKRLKRELSAERREQEEAKARFRREQDKKLSLLLYDEQEELSKFSILNDFLQTLAKKVEDAEENTVPTVYFAYAWPSSEREKDEAWVQPFLKILQEQLRAAGITTAKLDIKSNRYGANIYEFMKGARTSDYVLLFGTESLSDKHEMGLSAVSTELIEISRKRREDAIQGLRRVFPILISGNIQDSFPPEYERYNTVRDWRVGGYLHHFQCLYLELFGFAPEGYLSKTKALLEKSCSKFPQEVEKMRQAMDWYAATTQQVKSAAKLEELDSISAGRSLPKEELRKQLTNVQEDFPSYFVYRKTLLEELYCHLFQSPIQSPVVVYGPGGIGKTELVLSFAAEYSEEFSVVWVISADTEENLLTSYRELARRSGDPALKTVIEDFESRFQMRGREIEVAKTLINAVHQFLESSSQAKPFLLIYDNAEKEMTIPAIPKGKVILTSQNKMILREKGPYRLEMPSFSEPETQELLEKMLKGRKDPLTLIQKLGEELDYLPVNLVQAAFYLIETDMPIETYLRELNRKAELIMRQHSGAQRYPKNLHAILNIALEKLKQSQEGMAGYRWLQIWCYMHSDQPSLKLFKKWLETQNQGIFEWTVIASLVNLGFVKKVSDNQGFSFHRTKQAILRENMRQEAGSLPEPLKQALILLSSMVGELEPKLEDWPLLSEWDPHAESALQYVSQEACLEERAIINRIRGHWASIQGKDEVAEGLFREATEEFHQFYQGKDRTNLYRCLRSHGNKLLHIGRYCEGKTKLEEALSMQKRIYGEESDHPHIAGCLTDLGWAYFFLEEKELAMKHFEEGLAIAQKVYLQDDMGLANAIHGVGVGFCALGRPDEGLKKYKEALAIQRRLYEHKDHPAITRSLRNMSVSLGDLGKGEEALEKDEEALAMRRRLYQNQDHKGVAHSLQAVGMSLERLGRDEEALQEYEKALAMNRKLYPNQDHQEIAKSLRFIGVSFSRLGRIKEALEKHKEALAMIRRLYPNQDHQEATQSLRSIGANLSKLGRNKEALEKHEEALAMSRRLYPSQDQKEIAQFLRPTGLSFVRRRLHPNQDHEEIAQSLYSVGVSLSKLWRHEEALEKHEEALSMRRRLCRNQDDKRVAHSLQAVGMSLERLGRDEEALEKHEKALAMNRRLYPSQDHKKIAQFLRSTGVSFVRRRLHPNQDNEEVAQSLYSVGVSLSKLGREKEALEKHEEALAMNRELYPDQDRYKVALSLYSVGLSLEKLGRIKEASKKYKEAFAMNCRLYPNQDSEEVAQFLYSVGVSLSKLGRIKEALENYNEALAMNCRLYPNQDNKEVAKSLYSVGASLSELGREQEALEKHEGALVMNRRLYPNQDNEEVAQSLHSVGVSLSKLEREQEALEKHEEALAMNRRLYPNQNNEEVLAMNRRPYADKIVVRSLYSVALSLERLGREEEALEKYNEAFRIESNPTSFQESM